MVACPGRHPALPTRAHNPLLPPSFLPKCPRPRSKRPKSDWEGGDGGVEATPAAPSQWGATPGPAGGNRWDATPGPAGASGSRWDATPGPAGADGAAGGARRNRWDATPAADVGATPAWGGETPAAGGAFGATPGAKKRSRWDETPAAAPGGAAGFGATPAVGGAFGATPAFTPGGAAGLETPAIGAGVPMTPEQYHQYKAERELEARNRPLSDEELDAILPGPEDGYKVRARAFVIGACGTGRRLLRHTWGDCLPSAQQQAHGRRPQARAPSTHACTHRLAHAPGGAHLNPPPAPCPRTGPAGAAGLPAHLHARAQADVDADANDAGRRCDAAVPPA